MHSIETTKDTSLASAKGSSSLPSITHNANPLREPVSVRASSRINMRCVTSSAGITRAPRQGVFLSACMHSTTQRRRYARFSGCFSLRVKICVCCCDRKRRQKIPDCGLASPTPIGTSSSSFSPACEEIASELHRHSSCYAANRHQTSQALYNSTVSTPIAAVTAAREMRKKKTLGLSI
jgi:hypothetical protein